MFKTFLKTALISSLLTGASLAQAGWFAQASESYLVKARQFGRWGLSVSFIKPILATVVGVISR